MAFFDNKTITLFNRSFNAETEEEKYYLTLLDGIDLVESKSAHVSKGGMDDADAVKMYIHFSDPDTVVKPYISPKAWAALTGDEKKEYITFTPATDFFVKGNCTDLELPEENIYEWMRENFDDVYKVTTVEKYEDILPHFEVGGA